MTQTRLVKFQLDLHHEPSQASSARHFGPQNNQASTYQIEAY